MKKLIVIAAFLLGNVLFAQTPYIIGYASQDGNKFLLEAKQFDNNRQQLSYEWNVMYYSTKETQTLTGEFATANIPKKGFYKITATATNNAGESYTATTYKYISALVEELAPLPIADFTVELGVDSLKIQTTSKNAKYNNITIYKDLHFVSYHTKTDSLHLTGLETGSYRIQVVAANRDAKVDIIDKTFVIEEPAIEDIPDNNSIVEADYTLGTPTQNIKSTYITYSKQIDMLGAQTAYDQGWTGQGVTVAVLDTGVSSIHPELSGRVLDGYSTVDTQDGTYDDNGHGSFVAGVIASENDDMYGTTGIAYDAEILPVRVMNQGQGSFASLVQGIAKTHQDGRAKVANISVGMNYLSSYDFSSNNMDVFKNALNDDLSFVIAAGNDGLDCKADIYGNINNNCNMIAVLPSIEGNEAFSTSDGAWIVVGSVGDDKVISEWSNRAGVTKDYYMVAYGENITSIDNTGNYVIGNGTSFAAPQVTGAFALLGQKFPYLKGREIQDILLQTADDLGATGVDEVYGHGLLNIDTAMQPVGELQIVSSRTIDPSYIAKYSISSTTVSGTSASSGILKALAYDMKSIGTFDDYNRAYTVNLSANVDTENIAPGFSFNNYTIFQPQKTNLIIGLNEADQSAILGYSITDNTSFYIGKDDTYLGLDGSGALSVTGNTYYFGMKNRSNFSNLNIDSSISFGKSSGTASQNSLLTSIGDSTLVGYEFAANYNGFSLGIKRDMMPISGSISYQIPKTRTLDNEVVYDTKNINLSTKLTKNVDFVAKYQTNVSWSDSTKFSVGIVRNSLTGDTIRNANFTITF